MANIKDAPSVDAPRSSHGWCSGCMWSKCTSSYLSLAGTDSLPCSHTLARLGPDLILLDSVQLAECAHWPEVVRLHAQMISMLLGMGLYWQFVCHHWRLQVHSEIYLTGQHTSYSCRELHRKSLVNDSYTKYGVHWIIWTSTTGYSLHLAIACCCSIYNHTGIIHQLIYLCRNCCSCSIQKFLHARCPQWSTHHSPKLSSTSTSTFATLSSLFSPQIMQALGAVGTIFAV